MSPCPLVPLFEFPLIHSRVGNSEQPFERVAIVGKHRRAGADAERRLIAGPEIHIDRRDGGLQLPGPALRFGRIDVWVNNAGQGLTRLPSQLTDVDIDEMVRLNVKSVLYGTQEVLPHFTSRGTGHVINVSSLLGRIPFAPFRSAYNGAKHFLNALTANFRAEFQEAHPGIQFSLVSPGVVRTEFGLNAIHGGPDSRQIPDSQSAEEVAAVIADVIESRQPDVYTRRGAHDRIVAYYQSIGVDP